jgi:putative restriction endonuclease
VARTTGGTGCREITNLLFMSNAMGSLHLRVNPHNGLCLCTLHDKGFDRGFFTLADDYKIVIGKAIRQYLPNSAVHDGFKIYEGKAISLPDKFIPKQEFLEFHRENYFLG